MRRTQFNAFPRSLDDDTHRWILLSYLSRGLWSFIYVLLHNFCVCWHVSLLFFAVRTITSILLSYRSTRKYIMEFIKHRVHVTFVGMEIALLIGKIETVYKICQKGELIMDSRILDMYVFSKNETKKS